MRLDFAAQFAIVTEAGAGIGRAIAILLAERGAGVLVNDAAPDGRAQRVAEEIRGLGGKAVADLTPIGSHEGARAMAKAAREAFGSADILVNAASAARPGPMGAGDDCDIDRVLATNLLGPFALMRAVWPGMRKKGYGRILNISSSAAFGSGDNSSYAASKAGLIGLTKDAAIPGAADGINVNALMPSPFGDFRSGMRAKTPYDSMAAIAAWLVSRNSTTTGDIFTAGGWRVSRIAFVESEGVVEPDLTPDEVGAAMDKIRNLDRGMIINNREDHESMPIHLFSDRPIH